jgi:hypothetical protein
MTQYFPHLDCNTLTVPVYGVDIKQLIRYARVCILYFYDIQRPRARLLSTTLLSQGFLMNLFSNFSKCLSEDITNRSWSYKYLFCVINWKQEYNIVRPFPKYIKENGRKRQSNIDRATGNIGYTRRRRTLLQKR